VTPDASRGWKLSPLRRLEALKGKLLRESINLPKNSYFLHHKSGCQNNLSNFPFLCLKVHELLPVEVDIDNTRLVIQAIAVSPYTISFLNLHTSLSLLPLNWLLYLEDKAAGIWGGSLKLWVKIINYVYFA
jgi:hypothetical protein